MSQAYKQVINMLAEGSVDYRKIAIALATEQPSLFLKLAGVKKQTGTSIENFLRDTFAPDWMHKPTFIQDLRKSNKNKISLIKAIREASGMGLYEAKAFTEYNYLESTGMNNSNIDTHAARVFGGLMRLMFPE